ncbi:hypothetical protein [Neptuniibacter halophilus]|uniref:hypothetical protein n=1 Tax=Neptuniibacter halophilus TaxID=651666 RepID=UPI00257463F8|nr:hypothetical protein [Neptuniibacter halophilus]
MNVSEHTQQGLNALSYLSDEMAELKEKRIRMVAALLQPVLEEESPSALLQLIGMCDGTDITVTDILQQLHKTKFPSTEGDEA